MTRERLSFLLLAANGGLTKLGEQLSDPGLVLALLLSALQAPVLLVGALAPVNNGASLVPQLLTSGLLRRVRRRKWVWTVAALIQALALFAIPLAAFLHGLAAGLLVLLLLAVYSAASGSGSVVFSDVAGRTVGEGRRGRLLGIRAAAGGALVLLAGGYLGFRLVGSGDEATLLKLVLAAGALWATGALLFALLPEPAARPSMAEATGERVRAWRAFTELPGLRHFVYARCLLLAAELAMPFYALEAKRVSGGSAALGFLILAAGAAQLLGSPLFGRLADRRSSRLVMAVGGGVGVLGALLALAFGAASGPLAGGAFIAVFFLAALAEAAVRVGRKTYVVDASPPKERALFAATTNTAAGLVSLAYVALGALASLAGVRSVVVVLAVLGCAGVAVTLAMPARKLVEGRRAVA